MSAISRKEAAKKLKEEKKRIKEEEKRLKREEKDRKKRGGGKPVVGQVIGAPTNFSHDTHVGWDTERGFELRNIPPEWQRLFKEAGVKRSELEDPETRAMLFSTVRQSVMMGKSPVGAPAPAPPPPPPVLGAPPPPSMGPASPIAKRNPYAVGAMVKAIWSGDGQWYAAKIDAAREEDGQKYFTVTFTEYGNQEEVSGESVRAESNGMHGKEQGGMESLLKLQANNLRAPDISNITASQEESIVDSVQKALEARRKGMCFSVYGHDAVDENKEEWEIEDNDESWMDF